MTNPVSLECISCRKEYPLEHFDRRCDICAVDGIESNLTVRYNWNVTPKREVLPCLPTSLWRYEECLPLKKENAVSLGEGCTPVRLLQNVGYGSVWIKDESCNPTWSFKDRLASVAVSWAKHIGAPAIVTSSTGNAGAAAAAYAARAGLPCIVLTSTGTAGAMLSQMLKYGAMVISVPSMEDRWAVLQEAVKTYQWFPTSPFFGPAVGSNPIGLEGYKTISYEIAEAFDWEPPDWCVLPVCYGDALFGMWKGFEEMRLWGWIEKCPRFIAAEVSGSLSAALERRLKMPPFVSRNHQSIANSIDVNRGTYQALFALSRSKGVAVTLKDSEISAARDQLATGAGVFVEFSSAAAFAAIESLIKKGNIMPGEKIIALLTASGLKDIGSSSLPEREIPVIAPSLGSVMGELKASYGFDV